jgi:predicted nucleotidyltransferase
MTYKIDRLFGSVTRTRLLSRFMLDPDRTFYIRELSVGLNIPYSMLYKEIKNLESLGILMEEKRGRITVISLNKSLPYLDELKGLIIKTSGLAYVVGQGLSEFKDIRYALIYGSFASGTETAKSDADLLLIGDADATKLVKRVGRMEQALGREVNYIIWSSKELRARIKAGSALLADIARSPIIMIIGDEDGFRGLIKRESDL